MLKISGKYSLLCFSIIVLSSCLNRSSTPCQTYTTIAVLPDKQTPLPPFLRDVHPEPGSRTTRAVFIAWPESEDFPFFYPKPAAICVHVELKNLLEENDYNLYSDHHTTRSSLEASSIGSNSCSVPVRNDCVAVVEAGGTLTDERGNEIGGVLIFCWDVDLAPNVYEATYEYTQTSGHVLSYTWSFEITE